MSEFEFAQERLFPSPQAPHGGRSALPIDLGASLNPLGPSPLAVAAVHATDLTRYPDPTGAEFAAAAAKRHDIPVEGVVPVPGASWGLWFCLVSYGGRGRRCIALGPCFGEYRRAAEIAGCAFEETVAGLEAALAAGPDVLLVGNPANPSGAVIAAEAVVDACARRPATLFVVDEAFAAFAPAGVSLVEGRLPPENAIVVRSLTKELGLPGLRMGYLVARPERASRLRAILPAWPLSSPALAAAIAGCADAAHIHAGAEVGWRHVRQLATALAEVGLEAHPSAVNYLLCHAPGLHDALAARGIAARDCASFGLPGHVRMAAPRPEDLETVLDAIGRGVGD